MAIFRTNIRLLSLPFQALPRSQLLGSIDLDTREWTNGVLTVAALRAVEEPPEVTTWIVCDGDVDPEWVESLNSVLVGCTAVRCVVKSSAVPKFFQEKLYRIC